MELSPQFLQNKRLLGIDFGEKVIGTALYCWGRDPYPMPFQKIENKSPDYVLKQLNQILDEELIDIMIIGIPYLLDGQSTNSTKKAQQFVKWLQSQHPQTPCIEQDETLSTFEAKERMKNSPRYNFKVDIKEIDTLSASIILEQFQERVRHEN